MIKDRWENTEYMMEIHGLTKESLHVFAWKDRRDNGGYTQKVGKQIFYNAGRLERRQKAKEDDWHKSHDLYYIIQENLGMSDTQMGRSLLEHGYGSTLDSWRAFMSQGMWMLLDGNTILGAGTKKPLTEAFIEWGSVILQDENDMRNYDSVDDYYDYFEAKKLKKDMVS